MFRYIQAKRLLNRFAKIADGLKLNAIAGQQGGPERVQRIRESRRCGEAVRRRFQAFAIKTLGSLFGLSRLADAGRAECGRGIEKARREFGLDGRSDRSRAVEREFADRFGA